MTTTKHSASPGSGSFTPVTHQRDLKIAVVVNPRAGSGRVARQWPQLERAIREQVGPFTVFESLRLGHVHGLVQNALRDGFDRIVAVGGDGTVYEVINGFFEGPSPINPDASLAIIPMGTGCDFAKSVNVPKGLEAVPLIAKTQTLSVDVGRVTLRLLNGREGMRYFINVADVGMGGAVVERVNGSTKRLGGFVTFLWSVLAMLASYRNCRLTMEIDDAPIEQRCRDVIIAKGRYYGGGMRVAPDARLDSGIFEVFVIGDISVARVIPKLPKLYLGRLKGDPYVKHFRAKKIVVRSPDHVPLNLDGEHPGELPATIDLVPSAIKLVVG